jgi:hypothetical protein
MTFVPLAKQDVNKHLKTHFNLASTYSEVHHSETSADTSICDLSLSGQFVCTADAAGPDLDPLRGEKGYQVDHVRDHAS